jgi:hypothetical protein
MTRRTQIRRRRAAGVVVLVAVIAAVFGGRLQASPSSTASSFSTPAPPIDLAPSGHRPRTERHGALGQAGGAVPAGTTVFDDGVPGVAKLDPALLGALRQAATDAGVRFVVDSGWRSPEYQEQLLQQAIAKYGSKQEAARWVATPETSEHVSGNAVDVATAAAAWLAEHGTAYGLCQIYGNEPWHYELRPTAVEHGCPPTYADPTHDPRMQK